VSPTLTVIRRPAAFAAETLMVLLPGAYMRPQHFLDAGFDTAVAERRLGLDLAFPDFDAAGLANASGIARLRIEILGPAQAAGYRQLWLGGISLGALLALAVAADGGEEIDGLCLIAPYPGSAITLAAIDAAGGPARWQPTDAQLADAEFRIWDWLRLPRAKPQICFGYGRHDRFAPRMARLAACRPDLDPVLVDGDHEWPAWRAIWNQFLDSGRIDKPSWRPA
jgi:pimeloyl-ACP methyl ester carboxylesterase